MGCQQSEVMAFINSQASQGESPPQQNVNHGNYTTHNPNQQTYQHPPQPTMQTYQHQNHQQQVAVQQSPPNANMQTQQQTKVGKAIVQKKMAQLQREYLQQIVNVNDDFLTHHLKHELTLTKLINMKRIKHRQLVQHIYLQALWGNVGGVKDLNISYGSYQETLISAWTQTTFLDIWEQGHNDFFVKHLQEKEVRRKISEQFMAQLYLLKQYVDAGLGKINFLLQITRTNLISFAQSSDDALFNIFKKLKDRYPQTGDTTKIQFPKVPSTKTNINLFDHFPNLSFTDPQHMNYQTIYEDINFLLKKAIEEQQTFKQDMKLILGDDVLACPKVGQVNKDGSTSFNACAVRRVFVKWAQNLLEKCPDLVYSKAFMKFIGARGKIINNFFFKSTIQPTTHKIVIDCISLLLQVAKYQLKDRKKRDAFIFNIYDLLRCKIKRKSPEQIVNMLKKMEQTKVTKNGKKFEVIRVKNRFQTNNRDLLINFRYGDVLVGQAQLCIDNANVSKEAKHNYQFCHYIYELQRSLFGPTLQLMMQYQDFQRPDITVNFQAEDLVAARGNQLIDKAGPVNRKCFHGHDMITISGNYFFPARSVNQTQQQTINTPYISVCNYCDKSSTVLEPYDYCYHCACYLCTDCRQKYSKEDTSKFLLSIQRKDLLPNIGSFKELQNLCNQKKSVIVLFCLEGSSPSTLFRDCMIFHQGKLLMQPQKYIPNIVQASYSNSPQFADLCNKFGVTEFPTLILFDSQVKAIRTVIGFSWLEAPALYATQERLIKGQSIDLDIYCNVCEQKMEAQQIKQGSFCLTCFGTSKPINLPSQLLAYGAYCSQNHYRCLNCIYSALSVSSTYKDQTGRAYLSVNYIKPALTKCPKGHQTVLSKAPPVDSWTFNCFKCKSIKFFDNEHGVGECSQCKNYICSGCLGAPVPTFKQIQEEGGLVTHYVQSTAQQGLDCVCNRHFKKVYSSRLLDLQELINGKDIKKWTCFLCRRIGKTGELHIACYGCPVISAKLKKKYNFEICLQCASYAKILLKEPKQKAEYVPTPFKCPKDGQSMVKTSMCFNKQLVVSCFFCKKKYFGNTQRFYCQTCNINCCQQPECRKKLWGKNAPTCKQKCLSSHNLTFHTPNEETELDFCNGCMTMIREESFKCIPDDYCLCQNCARTQPANFQGHILDQAIKGLRQQFGHQAVQEQSVEVNPQSYHQAESEGYNYGGVFSGYEQTGSVNFLDDFFD